MGGAVSVGALRSLYPAAAASSQQPTTLSTPALTSGNLT